MTGEEKKKRKSANWSRGRKFFRTMWPGRGRRWGIAAAQTNSFLPPSEHSLLLSRHRAMNDKRRREQGGGRGGGRSRELISSNFGGEGIKQKVGNEGGGVIFLAEALLLFLLK